MDNYKPTVILLLSFLLFHHARAVVNTIRENGKKTLELKENFEKGEAIKLKRDNNYETQTTEAEDRISQNDLSSGLLTQYSSELPPISSLNVPLTLVPPANSFTNFRMPDLSHVNLKFPFPRPFSRPAFSWKMGLNLGLTKTFQGPTIPSSLEAYGPPRKSGPPFLLPNDFKRLSGPRISNNLYQHGFPGLRIRNAPPTPPDIQYTGWQPIAGIPVPAHQNLLPEPIHVPDSHHSSQNIDPFQVAGIPSNSYGEPINNPADHNLKQQVSQGDTDAAGLPPPLLPESEPLHNIQEQTHLDLPQFLPQLPLESTISNNDLSIESGLGFQQLPKTNNEPLKSFDNFENVDSYLVPPPSSFSPTGPYPASRRPDYSKRHQHAYHIPRNNGPIRPHTSFPFSSLPSNLIPPRNWASKFRDSTGEFSALTNMYSLPTAQHTQFEKPAEALTDPDVSMSFNQLLVNDDVLSALNADQNSTVTFKSNQLYQFDDNYDNSLASSITNEIGSDDIQVQGSQGIYKLQIQPADGLKGADDVVHSQLLSGGLLQNIIAAIEQPAQGSIDIQSTPQAQSLQQIPAHSHKDFIDYSAASSSIPITDKLLIQVDINKSIETIQ